MADRPNERGCQDQSGQKRGGRCSSTHLEILRLAIPPGGRLGYDDVLCWLKSQMMSERNERQAKGEKNAEEEKKILTSNASARVQAT